MSGSSSRRPVATRTRRAVIVRSPRSTPKRSPSRRRAVTRGLLDAPAVLVHLSPAERVDLRGWGAVAGQEVVHLPGRCVARIARIEDQHRAARPGQRHRAAEPGGTAADDHHVIRLFHERNPALSVGRLTSMVAEPANGWCRMAGMAADDNEVLQAVGPRLRAVRQKRGATLAQLSRATGISVSTLSRLEAGGRRPTLELLLPLARAHQIPLDELIGAPATGDPRVHAKPVKRQGRTLIPLTRRPGGVQAYKMLVPPGEAAPELQSHEGYEWMYVLAGRLRLRLGELDLVQRLDQLNDVGQLVTACVRPSR